MKEFNCIIGVTVILLEIVKTIIRLERGLENLSLRVTLEVICMQANNQNLVIRKHTE